MTNNILYAIDLAFRVFLLFCSTVYLYNSIVNLINNKKTFQYYFYLIYYIFFIFPVWIRILFPNYQYIIFWRANEAMQDYRASIIYEIFVLIFMFVIMHSARHSDYVDPMKLTNNLMLIRVCTIVMLVALVITLFTNGISILYSYASGYVNETYDVNEVIVGCGTISYLVLLGHKKYLSKPHLFLVTAILVLFFWMVGKRYIVAETVIMCVYVLSITGEIQGRKFIKLLTRVAIVVLVFCVIYGMFLKGNFISLIDYINVDFNRQYTLVYQIHCKFIGKEISINQYDAIIYLFTFWIPRIIWSNKPYPFVNQLTYSLVSSNNIPSGLNMGWATTCSIFSDLFDSFSYVGLWLGIILFIVLFKRVNKSNKTHYKILLMYFCVRLITVQISSAILQIVVCFVIYWFCDKFGRNKTQDNYKEDVDESGEMR